MAVYERTYKRYVGEITPQWSRFLVLPRYAFRDVFASKRLLGFFVICFFYPLALLARIYILNNGTFLDLFEVETFSIKDLLAVDGEFFSTFLTVQGFFFAIPLTIFVGPGLVSRDYSNNGLPLYLARPFSRTEYSIGKLTILASLLSAITWIPGLLLYALQSNYAGMGWMMQNLRLAIGVFVGSWLWILVLSVMALAMSAWVRWRPVAAFSILMILLGGMFFANIINLLFRTDLGHLVSLIRLTDIVWAGLIGVEIPKGPPLFMAWVMLAAFVGFCVFLLDRKIRAYESVS